ncbi:MAG: AraC family transcriptional regulator [Christensenellales bacterium]
MRKRFSGAKGEQFISVLDQIDVESVLSFKLSGYKSEGETMNGLISIGMQSSLTACYPKHSHNYWEITYYFEGSGVNITDGKEYAFSAGTIMCQPPNVPHEDVSSGYKNIYFLVEEFAPPCSEPLALKDLPGGDFLYILKKLYTEYHSRKSNHKKITESLLGVLYLYLLEMAEFKKTNRFVAMFEKRLAENLSNSGFSVLAAARELPLCEDYFRRLFKRETGKSPQQYLQDIRISYAMQLLKNSSLPLKNVCLMSGYADPYYFSRIFKKHTGTSPDNWRKNRAPQS